MLYIIVPVHNRINTTVKFITSLRKQNYTEYSLVIVNDGSKDNTKQIIEESFPETTVIEGNGNLFWGGGINAGLNYISGFLQPNDFIAFANNDTILFDDTITQLMKYAENEKALFHSLVIKSDQQIISSGAKIVNWPLFITRHPFRGKKLGQINFPEKEVIDLMTARFVVFKATILNSYPSIDITNFPHYVGDNDFSMSLKKMGIKTYIIPASKCIIDVSTTGDNPHKLRTFRSVINSLTSIRSTNNLVYRYRFGKKHCPKLFFPFYIISMLIQVAILNIIKKAN
jgi:GT2 family glycosyltransferase